MTRFKDFGSGADSADIEPLAFKLHGEDFFCRPQLQGKILLNLVANTNSDDPVEAARTINKFFDFVLTNESKEPFNNLLEDPDRMVSVDTLSEIVTWLIEEYTARPNQQPEA
jgi:hypothetical protein